MDVSTPSESLGGMSYFEFHQAKADGRTVQDKTQPLVEVKIGRKIISISLGND